MRFRQFLFVSAGWSRRTANVTLRAAKECNGARFTVPNITTLATIERKLEKWPIPIVGAIRSLTKRNVAI